MKKLTNKATGTLKVHDVTLSLLKANDFVANMIRNEMKKKNILVINLVSSPGSGKTTLLEETLKRLKDKLNIVVLEGDLETERDADRIRKQGCSGFADCYRRALPPGSPDDSPGLAQPES
jgi:hydrogenase nickel incorporation protein HypB